MLLQLKLLLLGEQDKMLLGPDREWATGKPAAVCLPLSMALVLQPMHNLYLISTNCLFLEAVANPPRVRN